MPIIGHTIYQALLARISVRRNMTLCRIVSLPSSHFPAQALQNWGRGHWSSIFFFFFIRFFKTSAKEVNDSAFHIIDTPPQQKHNLSILLPRRRQNPHRLEHSSYTICRVFFFSGPRIKPAYMTQNHSRSVILTPRHLYPSSQRPNRFRRRTALRYTQKSIP